MKIYRRKARKPLFARTCWHWEHIKKRHSIRGKFKYLLTRKLRIISPSWGHDACIHRGDGMSWYATEVNTTMTGNQHNVTKDSTAYKSWSDKSICMEIFKHQKHNQPLCLDCQRYWDSWSEVERIAASTFGRLQYNDVFGLKDDGTR